MHSPRPSSSATASQRRYEMDWLRIAVFGLLILNHVGMYYGAGPWFVKSPAATSAIEPVMYLSFPWRLALLFLISGAATAFLLSKSPRDFLGMRSRRLLIPLVFAVFVLIPPQMYYAAIEHVGYSGGYLEFWVGYVTVARTACGAGDCFDAPTWSHLWFVFYLWFYTVLIWAAMRWFPSLVDSMRRMLVRAMQGGGLLLWPALVLVVLRLLLRDSFPPNFSFVGDWYRHAAFLLAFLFGFLVARERAVWQCMAKSRWTALGLWFASYVVLAWYVAESGADAWSPGNLRKFMHVMFGLNQWTGLVTLVGLATHLSPGDSRARRYLTEAIFPYYIVHQTAIVVISQELKPLELSAPLEAVALIVATVATCAACFEVVRRVGGLRPLFGLRKLSGD